MMKILVTIKRVTDPDVKVRLLPDGSGVDTANIEYKINPFDEYALEEALRLREANPGRIDEIVVVSVGSDAATKELRVAMAMGADRGILVDCEDSQYDPGVLAAILAQIIKQEGVDIVMMGKLAVDGENNQVAQRLAHLLGYGQGTFTLEMKLLANSVLISTQADGGTRHLEVALPAVITRADMKDEDVRYASLPNIMKAKRKPLATLTPADLKVDLSPKVRTLGYEVPAGRAAGQRVESVDALVDKLVNEAKVL
ncbi:MAG: electron transfer flavoprotein subunit beta/FixA family protein [Bradymonadales bacterium]|nr:electron transfer flavoprotein subunit beta/FixA family protein [Bradymonadales bacterium]